MFLHTWASCATWRSKGQSPTGKNPAAWENCLFRTNLAQAAGETDHWNYPELEKFKACPLVSVRTIQYVIRRLDGFVKEKVRQFAERKKSLKDKERESQGEKQKNQPDTQDIRQTTQASQPSSRSRPHLDPFFPSSESSLPVDQMTEDTEDAFIRNQKDIRPFVRAFGSSIGNIPRRQMH